MARGYQVTVYRKNLSALYQLGGPGDRWAHRLAERMEAASIIEAPARSGEIKRSHSVRRRGINQWAAKYAVVNSAGHAEWVHDGTRSPILPVNAKRLKVPNRGGGGYRLLPKVRGQAANPWLDRACARVARSAGAVPFST